MRAVLPLLKNVPGRPMVRLSRLFRHFLRRRLRRHMRGPATSRQIAGGVALGVFVGFTPTMGLQMVIAGVLATLVKVSRIPAMMAVYITNPFTAAPIYGACYLLGANLLRPFGFRPLRWEVIQQLFVNPEDVGFWEKVYDKLDKLFHLGRETFAALWLGCTLAGIAFAVISYYVTLRFVTGHRLIKAERQARRAARRLERVTTEQELKRRHEDHAGGNSAEDRRGTGTDG